MRVRVVVAALGMAVPALAAPVTFGAAAAAAPVATTVSFDASAATTPLNNPAGYQNQTGPVMPPGNERSVHAIAPRLTRVWASPRTYVSGSGEYQFDKLYEKFDQVARHSDRMMLNLLPCAPADLANRPVCETRLKAGLEAYKRRYPMLEYVEIFNELDKTWTPAPGEDAAMTPAEYYSWYRFGYSIVNEINAELNPTIPLKVGGPVGYKLNYDPVTKQGYLKDFLRLYKDDPSAGKRLDFISYHRYDLVANPATAATDKSIVRGLLTDVGLAPDIPVFVTEYGIFPGSRAYDTMQVDQLTQAAAMSALGTHYAQGGIDGALHWTFNHETQERKSMFVDGVDGAVLPYYNVVAMQSMLKTGLLRSTVSTAPTAGRGVSALATTDGSGVAALVTNYQGPTGTASHDVTLAPGTLPWPGRDVRVDRYLVDRATSNYNASPANASLRRVESVVVKAGASPRRTFNLTPNAVSLVVYTPLAQRAETESLPTSVSGGTQADIADADASGGKLNKYAGAKVGDSVSYTVNVAKAGTYDVSLRVKKTPERGIARLAVDGTVLGAPVDAYSSGYSFDDVHVGSRTLAAGNHTFTFTLTGTSGTGLTVGVDYLELRPRHSRRIELERYVPRATDGAAVAVLADTSASGGGVIKADTRAPGEVATVRFAVPEAGRYALTVGAKRFPSRGTCQFTADGVDVGEPHSLYAPAAGFAAFRVGTVDVPAPGNWTLGCRIVGRDASSTGYDVALDYAELTQLPPSSDAG